VRAMQCTQFRAKSEKNDLKPTDFLKGNFYLEMEGVLHKTFEYFLNQFEFVKISKPSHFQVLSI